jgi:hypothetical protein
MKLERKLKAPLVFEFPRTERSVRRGELRKSNGRNRYCTSGFGDFNSEAIDRRTGGSSVATPAGTITLDKSITKG